jgi:hypothetical protein
MQFLSRPAGLIPVALLVEEAFLFTHVASYAKRKFVFPPPAYATGSFDSLLRTLFFWAPRVSWTWCYPKLEAFAPHSALWPAEAWW